MTALTIFYDGHCPLCQMEMQRLYRRDYGRLIRFVDIQMPGFSDQYPDIDPTTADSILHGKSADGTWLYGLDVTVAAWQLVGRGRWMQYLRRGWLRGWSDRAYLFFARNRYRISALFTGKSRCTSCELGNEQGRC